MRKKSHAFGTKVVRFTNTSKTRRKHGLMVVAQRWKELQKDGEHSLERLIQSTRLDSTTQEQALYEGKHLQDKYEKTKT